MSSKQINFFITSSDWIEIDAFFKAKDCIFLKGNISNLEDKYLGALIGEEHLVKTHLTRKDFSDRILYHFLESKQYYYVDILKSLAIEFDPGGFYPYTNKEFNRGRLYYVSDYYNEKGTKSKKELDFLSWADDVLKGFKRKFLTKSELYPQSLFSVACVDWSKRNGAKLAGGGMKLILE